ncbi:hypothetical protein A8L34_26230 [Bacillus sp. FJAT-27264]|uniref:GyrI-like domain-containing protein n=1 Tax=Paenibacillus sp. (strain DSM 101736 / FJAT-27264) TaxID=1850362 RepID=UPI000807B06F|nr:GyrI-like domain-containing protein [Bacillus sp. FJAT-27264]OBZ07627.1 hypothetical protein A8L34_26230 [Bacillus sp. FJAT-27264]
MNTAKKLNASPEGYGPKEKPLIMSMVEEAKRINQTEVLVEQVNEFCAIVDRSEVKIVGVGLTITYESRGYGFGRSGTVGRDLNDYFFARKMIAEGETALLADILGVKLANQELLSARYDITGDGNYSVVVGIAVDSLVNLPAHLPENTVTLTIPACRYAKILINGKKQEGRAGYDERMQADEYFVNGFRTDTKYIYNSASFPFNTYDEDGDMLVKYEPIKLLASAGDSFETLRCRPVTLLEMKMACSVTPPDSEEFVITKYFEVEQQVFAVEAAQYYLHDYYGFPVDTEVEGQVNSCFGTRVSSFEGLPDGVEKITLPGGIYLHISQLEFNGDNPAMPYDAAFNHLDELFLASHPQYERDWSRHVIARFRQANCASVFVPLLYNGI